MRISLDFSGSCLYPWKNEWMAPMLIEALLLLLVFIGYGGCGCMPPLQCMSPANCTSQLGSRTNSYTLFPCGSGNRNVCCPPRQQTPVLTNKMALLPQDICGVSTDNKIIGGTTADRGQFPWMALLGYREHNTNGIEYLCGGSIINERYILTAAHCLQLDAYDLVTVRLGELNLTTNPDCELFCAGICEQVCSDPVEDYEVESFKIHEKYSSARFKNDIALIRLKRNISSFQGEHIRPLCLPFGINITGNEESKFKIAGWGKTDNHDRTGSTVLQHATIQGVHRDVCNALQAQEVKPIDETQICAANNQGMDACKGDSGGPLMHVQNSTGKMYQVGIVSFGADPCGGRDAPSVYTRVAAYLNWILNNMEE